MSTEQPPPDGPTRREVSDLVCEQDGLVAVVCQDARTSRVLMVAWANREAIERTVRTGAATYWSRSRQELWTKGETSGNRQWVQRIEVDCDGDAVIYHVRADGPACHTGLDSCFDTGYLDVGPADAVVGQ